MGVLERRHYIMHTLQRCHRQALLSKERFQKRQGVKDESRIKAAFTIRNTSHFQL